MPFYSIADTFGAAETEVMPAEVDCMIMSSSPVSNFFELAPSGYSNSSDHEPLLHSPDDPSHEFCDFDGIWELPVDGPFMCRRVATFPPPGGHLPKPSNMKSMHRSKSESAALNHVTLITLDDLKRELQTLVISAAKRQHQAAIDAFEHKLTKLPNGLQAADIGSAGQSPVSSEGSVVDAFSPSRTFAITRKPARKKVSFADDRGHQLFSVRMMTEPSDVPPRISPDIIRRLVGDQEELTAATWELDFNQPCSEYLHFRQRLERQNVALENVMIKNDQCRLLGTVKVRNLGFEKSVCIRMTDNNWISYLDKEAKYSASVSGDPYDTFSFDFEIPRDDDGHPRLEFCVRFRCYEDEYWDSNDGKNFVLISQKVKQLWGPESKHSNAEHSSGHGSKQLNDAYSMDCQNWGNFASWQHLECQGPYW